MFEYHIAFYSVSPPLDPLSTQPREDPRRVRRAAVFGPDNELSDRFIYEEQLSFLYVGVGRDWGFCIQLFERYHDATIPSLYDEPTHSIGPSTIFFSWLTSAMHHVSFRWNKALEAIDKAIQSPSDIVFSGENIDLLSDDPRFSRSRTYFWALQVYKMFEERLVETISTWEKFYQAHEFEANDGVINAEQLSSSLSRISQAVESLRGNLQRVRARSAEVERLRQGLFGASALFDSRTAVRQGDNIRLLTYITILFLPLTFCTSIFGMQVVLPALPIKALIIAMPTIFVATVLIVMNLQNLADTAERATRDIATRLRSRMHDHHSDRWRNVERSLRHDKAAQELPNRRVNPQTTYWMYALFMIQALIIQIPVHELEWVRHWAGSKEASLQSHAKPKQDTRAARVIAFERREKERMYQSSVRSFARMLAMHLTNALRVLMLPLWTFLVSVDLTVVLLSVIFRRTYEPEKSATTRQTLLQTAFQKLGFGIHRDDSEAQIDQQQSQNGRPLGVGPRKNMQAFTTAPRRGSTPQRPRRPVDRWRRAKEFQASGLNQSLRLSSEHRAR